MHRSRHRRWLILRRIMALSYLARRSGASINGVNSSLFAAHRRARHHQITLRIVIIALGIIISNNARALSRRMSSLIKLIAASQLGIITSTLARSLASSAVSLHHRASAALALAAALARCSIFRSSRVSSSSSSPLARARVTRSASRIIHRSSRSASRSLILRRSSPSSASSLIIAHHHNIAGALIYLPHRGAYQLMSSALGSSKQLGGSARRITGAHGAASAASAQYSAHRGISMRLQ